MKIVTRFPPSPTGFLHVGNIRTALINYLFTLKHSGEFILRMDDTDLLRSRDEYREMIKEDLKWVGIKWDEEFRQYDRISLYEEYRDKLIKAGKIYACYETEEELNLKRKSMIASGRPPIYDRASLNLSESKIQDLVAKGRKPHYRFLLGDEKVSWNDLVRGEIEFVSRSFSDPVVFREDGMPTYVFCSVIDDMLCNVTHIIRGEDHVTNTAIQIQIFNALTDKLPKFAHLSLIKSKEGEISKRIGGFDIKTLRENGIHPMSINNMFAKIGTSDNISLCKNLDELSKEFDLDKFNKAPAFYDLADLEKVNRKLLADMELEEVIDYVNKNKINKDFWDVIKHNISNLHDIESWYDICYSDIAKITFSEDEKQVILVALNYLKQYQNWQENDFDSWIENIKRDTNKKGKDLFNPIRLAITGKENGPELKKLIPLIGLSKVIDRLER